MKCTPKDDDLERYFYIVDEQGSTTLITNNSDDIANEYYYDAFGNILESTEDVHNRITYTGQQFDSYTQQYYLRARFYNPAIGRFTQEDIYRGDGLNLYAYCRNNPVMYYDPSGYVCDSKKTSLNTEGGSKAIGATYEGTIYRSVDSRYDPLEMSQYTINSNHRYTESGVPGLYFSSGEKIVKAELGNYDVFDFSSRTMYSYDVRLTNMLDVSNPSVRSQLGISLESIVGESYDVTHAIGRYAYSNGYNGIIAPSARADGGINIILFNTRR